jgi:hypothetical protein
MSVNRSLLTRGTAYVNYNSVNFFTTSKIVAPHAPEWRQVMTSMFGPVDSWKANLVVRIPLRLYASYTALATLFPGYLLNPIPGASVYGTTDVPLVIQARNGDLITYKNAQLTKVANLYLGVDEELFSAEVEFTALLENAANPETAGSYHTRGTNAYSDATAAFSAANFSRTRFTAAWGGISGFTGMVPQKGIQIDWHASLKPIDVDGLGTVDLSVAGMIAQARMIPIGPTLAQMKSASQEETPMGTLGSALSADLVCTGNGGSPVITLKNAYLKANSMHFDVADLRVNEAVWETTRGFSAGSPAAIATAA